MAKELALETLLSAKQVDLTDLPFEKGLKLLEELVAKVEEGSLPLDQAMHAYERGVQLVSHLQGALQGAEEKLKILKCKSNGGVEAKEKEEI